METGADVRRSTIGAQFGHAGSWKKHGGNHHHKGAVAVTHTIKHTATAAPVVRTKTAVATKVLKTKVAATHAATKNVSRKPSLTKKKTTTSEKPSATHKSTSTKKSSARPSSTKKPVATHAPTTTKRPATTSKKPTTTSKKPAATATSKPTGFAAVALAAHNAARKDYGAGAMVWDAKLAADAQKWTDGCLWTHGGANGAGQNLAVRRALLGETVGREETKLIFFLSQGGLSSPQDAVNMWMAEAKDYKSASSLTRSLLMLVGVD